MKTLHSEQPPAAASHRQVLPGVTSSLLVSIKDDELEAEGERSPDTEDGGHKNDEVSSVSAFNGQRQQRRRRAEREKDQDLKEGISSSSSRPT